MEDLMAQLARLERLLVIGTKEVLTTEDLSLMTGMSKDHIRHLVCERAIPYYKPSGRLYFKKSEIEEWMLQNRVPTQAEVNSQAETYTTINRR